MSRQRTTGIEMAVLGGALRLGAFWEDRCDATAVDMGEHLARCLAYIDVNMGRTGVVTHPPEGETEGDHGRQAPRVRYRIVEREALAEALGLDNNCRDPDSWDS